MNIPGFPFSFSWLCFHRRFSPFAGHFIPPRRYRIPTTWGTKRMLHIYTPTGGLKHRRCHRPCLSPLLFLILFLRLDWRGARGDLVSMFCCFDGRSDYDYFVMRRKGWRELGRPRFDIAWDRFGLLR